MNWSPGSNFSKIKNAFFFQQCDNHQALFHHKTHQIKHRQQSSSITQIDAVHLLDLFPPIHIWVSVSVGEHRLPCPSAPLGRCWGIPRTDEKGNLSSMFWVSLGLGLGLLRTGHAWNTSPGRHLGGILARNHLIGLIVKFSSAWLQMLLPLAA